MATARALPPTATSVLLLADISGYTSFLRAVEAAHPEMGRPGSEIPPAYKVLSGLLDVVMDRIAPTFTLVQVEGDAVFAYASDDQLAGKAAIVVELVRCAYRDFREQLTAAMALHGHDCQACILLPSLELKFVIHRGTVVAQRIAGSELLAGPAVNVAHRLLKNSITEETGLRAYLFVSENAAKGLDLTSELGARHREEYADVGSVDGIVIDLDRRR